MSSQSIIRNITHIEHAIRNALSYDSIHIPSSSGTGKRAMRNGARQGGKGDKVGVHVNEVEVPGDV
jgi:hypothetical protein